MSLYLHLGLSQSLPIPNVALPSPRHYPSCYQSLMSFYLHPGFIPAVTYPKCHYLHPDLSQSLPIANVTTFTQALSHPLPIPNVTTLTQALFQSLPIHNVTLPSPRLYPILYQFLISLYLHPCFIPIVSHP